MRLNYKKLGEGKPLFILHGLFGLSDNWTTVGKILSPTPTLPVREGEKNISTYLIDLRNHGNSPHSDEWTYPAMAEDIRELIEETQSNKFQVSSLQSPVSSKQPKIILMGHSLGGKVAMQFASMYPEKLEKLIVADMAPKEYPGNSFDFIEKLSAINLAEMKSRKDAEAELRKIIKDEATIHLLLKNIQWRPHRASPPTPLQRRGEQEDVGNRQSLEWKFNLKVIAENQNKIGKTFSIKNNIDIPSLFIRGEKSNYISDADIPQIKKHFPNPVPIAIGIKTIAGAGHWVHADKPKEFAECVKDFLSFNS